MSAGAHCSRTSITIFASSADCPRGGLPLFWTVEPRPGKWSVGVKGEDSVWIFSTAIHYRVAGGSHRSYRALCKLAILDIEPSSRPRSVENRRSRFCSSRFSRRKSEDEAKFWASAGPIVTAIKILESLGCPRMARVLPCGSGAPRGFPVASCCRSQIKIYPWQALGKG